jgi:hypothetical protein
VVVLTFTGVPGTTYTAIGHHILNAIFNEEDFSPAGDPIYLGMTTPTITASLREIPKLIKIRMIGSVQAPTPQDADGQKLLAPLRPLRLIRRYRHSSLNRPRRDVFGGIL